MMKVLVILIGSGRKRKADLGRSHDESSQYDRFDLTENLFLTQLYLPNIFT